VTFDEWYKEIRSLFRANRVPIGVMGDKASLFGFYNDGVKPYEMFDELTRQDIA
jgi:hypothetical protein